MLHRIKKNDQVEVISGKDKGKQGRVLDIDLKKSRVMVKGAAIITKHTKPKRQGDTGGIVKEEAYLDIAKVMPVCSSCKKNCRIQVKQLEDGGKVRVCHRCKEAV